MIVLHSGTQRACAPCAENNSSKLQPLRCNLINQMWCQQIKYNPSSCFDNITELNRPEAMKNWLGSNGNRSNGQKASNNSSTFFMKLNATSYVTPPQSRKDWIDFFAVLCFWLFVMQHNTNYVWKTQWCTLPCRENTNLRLKKDSLCYLKINTKIDNGHNHFKSSFG